MRKRRVFAAPLLLASGLAAAGIAIWHDASVAPGYPTVDAAVLFTAQDSEGLKWNGQHVLLFGQSTGQRSIDGGWNSFDLTKQRIPWALDKDRNIHITVPELASGFDPVCNHRHVFLWPE